MPLLNEIRISLTSHCNNLLQLIISKKDFRQSNISTCTTQHPTLSKKKDSTYQRRIFRTCGLTLTTHILLCIPDADILLASKEKLKAA